MLKERNMPSVDILSGKYGLLYTIGLFAIVVLSLTFYSVGAVIPLAITILLATALQIFNVNTALYIIIIGNIFFLKDFSYINIEIFEAPIYITEYFLITYLVFFCCNYLLGAEKLNFPTHYLMLPYLFLGAVLAAIGLFDYGLLSVRHSAMAYYSLLMIFVSLSVTREKFDRFLYLLFSCSGFALLMYDIQSLSGYAILPNTGVYIISSNLIFVISLYFLRGRLEGVKQYFLDAFLLLPLVGFLTFPKTSLIVSYVAVGGVLLFLNRSRFSFKARHAGAALMFVVVFLASVILHSAAKGWSSTTGRLLGEMQALTNPMAPGESATKSESAPKVDYGTAQQNNANWRFVVWSHLLETVFTENPLFGIGFGPDYTVPELKELGYSWSPRMDPHNSYLHVLLRMGLLGVVFLCVPILIILLRAMRRLNSLPDKERRILTVFLAIFAGLATQAMFNVALENAYGATPFWTLLGLIAVVSIPKKLKQRQSEQA